MSLLLHFLAVVVVRWARPSGRFGSFPRTEKGEGRPSDLASQKQRSHCGGSQKQRLRHLRGERKALRCFAGHLRGVQLKPVQQLPPELLWLLRQTPGGRPAETDVVASAGVLFLKTEMAGRGSQDGGALGREVEQRGSQNREVHAGLGGRSCSLRPPAPDAETCLSKQGGVSRGSKVTCLSKQRGATAALLARVRPPEMRAAAQSSVMVASPKK